MIIDIPESILTDAEGEDDFFCDICLEYNPIKKKTLLGSCGHFYCRDCLKRHWLYKINNGDVIQLNCVEPSCDKEVMEEAVLALCDDEAVEKFRKFRTARLIQHQNGLVKFCTKLGCEGFAQGSKLRPKATCQTCGFVYCWSCNQPWHGWLDRCKHDKNALKLYKSFKRGKNIQSCPKCHAQIWKNEGCKHMTCQMCKYQFCWWCNRQWPCSKKVHRELWCFYNEMLYCPRCPCPKKLRRKLICCCFFLTIIPFCAFIFSMLMLWLILWIAVLCSCLWVCNKDLLDPEECLELFTEQCVYCSSYCSCCS